MEDQLLALQAACRERTHIQAILPEEPVRVLLDNGEAGWMLTVSRNGIDFFKGKSAYWHLRLCGEKEKMQYVLGGRERLHLYLQMKLVEVTGFYRLQLWLESLIWLCRGYEKITDN